MFYCKSSEKARLTDAIGRTTDFGNTVIVMTSNLGAQRAGQTVGFMPNDDQRHYIAAAEKFFRPEFFNRIDRVVPFHSLDREQIAVIAERLMRQVVSREGLMRRRCVLNVGPELISDIVDIGYDQAMGARGLKRAIEQHFTHPVAAELSAVRSETPTLITVRKKQNNATNELDINVLPLENVERTEQPVYESVEELVDVAEEFLRRVRSESFPDRPAGEISGSGMSPELLRYFALVEEANQIDQVIAHVRAAVELKADTSMPAIPISQTRRSVADREKGSEPSKTFLQGVASIGDIHQFLREASGSASDNSTDSLADRLVRRCRVLEAMARSHESEAIFYFKSSSQLSVVESFVDSQNNSGGPAAMQAGYHENAIRLMGFDWRTKEAYIGGKPVRLMYLSGSCVTAMLKNESGYSLSCNRLGKLKLSETGLITTTDPGFKQLKEAILSDEILTGSEFSCMEIESLKQCDVLRFWGHTSIDFRTGITIGGDVSSKRLLPLIQSGLPLPKELSQSNRKGNQ